MRAAEVYKTVTMLVPDHPYAHYRRACALRWVCRWCTDQLGWFFMMHGHDRPKLASVTRACLSRSWAGPDQQT